MHKKITLDSNPKSIITRLVRLTSELRENSDFKLESFPEHKKALEVSNLMTKQELESEYKTCNYLNSVKITKNDKKKPKKDSRKIYFVVPYVGPWLTQPISKTLDQNLKRFEMKRLRISMSYKAMPNLDMILLGDAQSKINKGYYNLNMKEFDCNCHGHKKNGCVLDGRGCRKRGVIYGMECQHESSSGEKCLKTYIGSTTQHAKTRINQHIYGLTAHYKTKIRNEQLRILPSFGDISEVTLEDQDNSNLAVERVDGRSSGEIDELPANSISDSFIRHMTLHGDGWFQGQKPTTKEIRLMTRNFVLKDLRVRNVGTLHCTICSAERVEIFVRKKSVMNSRNEIFGACRHKSTLIKPTKISH